MGENVQGPSKPERLEWHLPTACAPINATISWSLKLNSAQLEQPNGTLKGEEGVVPHAVEDIPDV